MKLELASVVLSFAILGAAVVGCGDDDYVEELPVADASIDATTDAGVADAASPADAGDPLEALLQCQDCIVNGCGPALVACLTDETCRDLATCAITSNCLSDPASCIPLCLTGAGLEPAEIVKQLLLLQQLATQCTGCFETCQEAIPGGGLDGGLGDGGLGFP